MTDLRWETWLLHARLPATRRAWERAGSKIREAVASYPGTWACCCSGGKDSGAMLDIAVENGWRGPVFMFVYEETPRENIAHVECLTGRYGLELASIRVVGAYDAFRRAGGAFDSPQTPEQAEAVRWMERTYKRQIHDFQREQGWAGVMIGMRRDESRRRSIVLAKKGWLYRVQSRPGWTCCPLDRMSSRDVLARIASRDLPVLERYLTEDDPETERSEETFLAADVWTRGQRARWKRRDLDAYQSACRDFPDIMGF